MTYGPQSAGLALHGYCNVCVDYICIYLCNVYCSDPLYLSFNRISPVSQTTVQCAASDLGLLRHRKPRWPSGWSGDPSLLGERVPQVVSSSPGRGIQQMTIFIENVFRGHSILILWSCFLIQTAIPCQLINVTGCPKTEEKWQIASQTKNCSLKGCTEVKLYHCVPTETGQLVEVCTSPINLQGVCPYYDTVGKRLQMSSVSCKSNNTLQNCSTRYPSTHVYKYKVCFPNTGDVSSATSGIHCKRKIPMYATLIIVCFSVSSYHKL